MSNSVKHWVIVDLINGEEKILPEVQLIEALGEKRWFDITSGKDVRFRASEYNNEFSDKGIYL